MWGLRLEASRFVKVRVGVRPERVRKTGFGGQR